MKIKINNFLKNVYKIIMKPEMVILPGQLAFYFVLSIVPTISLISYWAKILKYPTDFIYSFIANAFSSDIANVLISTDINFSSNIFQFLIVLLIAYYIASNGASSVIVTSNMIYGIKNKNYFERRLKALIMTIIMLFLLIFMLIIPAFSNIIYYLPSNLQKVGNVLSFFQGPVTWLIIFIFIKIIYTMAPDKNIKSRNVNFGALFTTICWLLGTAIYSYYINNYANYNAFYGGLANLVILMLWFYYLAYFFTIGMALNYRKEEEKLEKTNTIETKND
jgi:membrane protein